MIAPPDERARLAIRAQAAQGICFQCGRLLIDAFRRPINPRHRAYHGELVKLHAICSETFDREQQEARITAKPSDGR